MARVKDKVYQLRQLLEDRGIEAAARFVHPQPFESASDVMLQLLYFWLSKGAFHNAAVLLWGPNKFTPEPVLVQDTWESIQADSKLIVIGAASVGKSYNFAIWTLLDWIQDPDHTFVQCLSVSKEHAKTNVFAHLKDLHKSSIIPLPGEVKGESIASPSQSDKAGIRLRAIPKGDSGHGALRGFHPHPRAIPHPVFGKLSRIRLLLDEAEEIPTGIWEGVNNLLVSESENADYKGQIKVFAATNPKNRLSELGKRCEPLHGWTSIKADTDHVWVSKMGWRIQRLDAARSENVIEKRDVFPGMQTWKGYQHYLSLGVDNPEFWCVDPLTEVLSNNGWVNYEKLAIGDKIWTVNIDTGLAEWETVLEVFAKPYKGELLSFEGRGFSALATDNHKWPITNKGRLLASNYLTMREGKDLTPHDYISLARPVADGPSSYSDDFAELAGWLLSDGTMPDAKKFGVRVVIVQSAKANARKCQAIQDLLLRVGQKGVSHIAKDDMAIFYVTGNLAKALREACPGKKLTIDFISKLSLSGRQALLRGLTLGDGGRTGIGKRGGLGTLYVCTKDEQQAGLFSALMSMVGLANTVHKKLVPSGGLGADKGYNYPAHVMYYVFARASKFTRPCSWQRKAVPFTGVVWCPRTKNQTFLARRNGGVYYTGNTMGRGWFPEQGVFGTIIPPNLIESSKGTWIFNSAVTFAGGVDLAFAANGDNVMFSVFKYGYADSFRKPDGTIQKLDKYRWVIQFEDVFPLQKQDTLELCATIKALCTSLSIKPDWLASDATGNGKGVFDVLTSTFGPVHGVDYSTASTHTKVLDEDQQFCDEVYDGIVTELYFTPKKLMEAGYLKLNPNGNFAQLYLELTGRKFFLKGRGKVRVQSKDDYKADGNKSPDEGDSFCLGVAAIRRMAEDFSPAILPTQPSIYAKEPPKSPIDVNNFISFND